MASRWNFYSVTSPFSIISCIFLSFSLLASPAQTGSVRAADQFIPGASVTAIRGDTKVTTFTDESGRYSLDLAPGVWDIQVQVFGFTPVHERVTVESAAANRDWQPGCVRFLSQFVLTCGSEA